MQNKLAEKLLSKIMGWGSMEVNSERPLLQAISSFKYNEYQQFSPGIRYIESLAKWLEQFPDLESRKIAYQFIKDNLVFLSNDQITHLVNIAFTEKVNPILIYKTSIKHGFNRYAVNKIVKSTQYKEILRRCLFIGLSDGSRIDQFRRSNRKISNEQVFPSYYIQKSKAQDMIKELNDDGHNGKFNSLFLFDDFTASGKSYARKEEGKFKGKIIKLLQEIYPEVEPQENEGSPYRILLNVDDTLDIQIIFYVATRVAVEKVKEIVEEFKKARALNINIDIKVIQYIENQVRQNVLSEHKFIELISKSEYFDESIADSHYNKGKNDYPYLGFNECALPLILNHNTPNNSLPILWFPEGSKCTGLFPRVTRHKDE